MALDYSNEKKLIMTIKSFILQFNEINKKLYNLYRNNLEIYLNYISNFYKILLLYFFSNRSLCQIPKKTHQAQIVGQLMRTGYLMF